MCRYYRLTDSSVTSSDILVLTGTQRPNRSGNLFDGNSSFSSHRLFHHSVHGFSTLVTLQVLRVVDPPPWSPQVLRHVSVNRRGPVFSSSPTLGSWSGVTGHGSLYPVRLLVVGLSPNVLIVPFSLLFSFCGAFGSLPFPSPSLEVLSRPVVKVCNVFLLSVRVVQDPTQLVSSRRGRVLTEPLSPLPNILQLCTLSPLVKCPKRVLRPSKTTSLSHPGSYFPLEKNLSKPKISPFTDRTHRFTSRSLTF